MIEISIIYGYTIVIYGWNPEPVEALPEKNAAV
jgi:hypothetical protein